MKNIAPDLFRQRLLIEGYYTIDMDEPTVEGYLTGVAEELGLRTYGKPIVFAPAGLGSEKNQGFDAFVPLIDSGIALYVWSEARFYSAIIYSCKPFDTEAAVDFTNDYFRSSGNSVYEAV